MFPVALVELLEEGLVYFRYALTLYDKYAAAKSAVDFVSGMLDDDLRHHRSVLGEEVYLFILGRETVNRLLRDQGKSVDYVDQVTLYSVYQAIASRTSPDAKACIVDFAHALGQNFAIVQDNFIELLNDRLNSATSTFVLEDPVLSFIQNDGVQVPTPTMRIFEALSVDKTKWKSIVDNLKIGKLGIRWTRSLNEIPKYGVKPHRTQTFIGLILRGAMSVISDAVDYVPVTDGPDGLVLSLAFLGRPQPLITKRDKLSDARGITKEMVDTASLQSMAARGFVKTVDSGWLHISQVKTDTVDDKVVYVKRAAVIDEPTMEQQNTGAKADALDKVKNALVSSAKTHGPDLIKDFLKRQRTKL